MSGQKQHTHYTLSDIEQYLQGKLSPAEMHALEKAALQDPFLADAIEGYQRSDLTVAKTDLTEIREKLLKDDHTVLPIAAARNNRQWMRIAAIFILVIGAGAVGVFVFNNSGQKQELAQSVAVSSEKRNTDSIQRPEAGNPATGPDQKNSGDLATSVPQQIKQEKLLAAKENVAKRSAEATALQNRETLSQLSDEQKSSIASASPKESITAGNLQTVAATGTTNVGTISGTETVTLSASDASKNLSSKNITSLSETKDLTASLQGKAAGLSASTGQAVTLRGAASLTNNNSQQHVFTGRVITSEGMPVAGASVVVNNTNKGVSTDKNGNFTFIAADSVSKVDISAVGFESKDQQLIAKNRAELTLRPADTQLNEVVVTGYGRARKKDITGTLTTIDAKKTESEAVTPEKGWDEFRKYISEKISKKHSGVFTGAIKAELTLNRKGKATKVTIITSFDNSLNETVIQAIKDGPRWMLHNGKPGTEKTLINFGL